MILIGLGFGNNIVTVISATGTTDILGSTDIVPRNNDVSTNDTSYAHRNRMIFLYEIHDVSKIEMCHR